MRAASSIAIVIFTLVLVSQPMQGEVHAGDTTGLRTIQMVDSQTGWAVLVEPSGVTPVARTTNGGTHWKDVTPINSSGNRISVFQMNVLSSDIAWVMPAGPSGPTSTEIFRTVDGGRTWKSATIPALAVTSISFINPREGWLIAFVVAYLGGNEYADIYRSTNGGQTWTKVASRDDAHSGVPYGVKTSITFLNSTTGWMTALDPRGNVPYLYVTRDGGRTWGPHDMPLPPEAQPRWEAWPEPMKFFGGRDGILPVLYDIRNTSGERTGGVVVLYSTHDGGTNWTYTASVRVSMEAATRYAVADMNHAWVLNGGVLRATSNGGLQWTALPQTPLLAEAKQIEFISPRVGWAIRQIPPSLLKTLDGGRTWTPLDYAISR